MPKVRQPPLFVMRMGIKDSLDSEGLRPRKKWGQNFLSDPRILGSIAEAGAVSAQDTVLEIGPGLGHLTRVLASRAGQVVAVEIDTDLAAKLKADFEPVHNVEIRQGDILAKSPADWVEAGFSAQQGTASHFKVVANLPYYITSAILRHILEARVRPSTIVVMVQREVAQRMIARPPDMNLLAVSVQYYAGVHLVRTIAPGAFYPRPKVESSVVRLDVLPEPPLALADSARFFDLVRAGFGEKRKQLRNSLSRGLGLEPVAIERMLLRAGIDPKRRAETLTLADWQALYTKWSKTTDRA